MTTLHRLRHLIAMVFSLSLLACTTITPAGIHARMGYTEERGLRVVEVPRNGPAATAGLLVNDRVTEIDGEPVRNLHYADIVERLRGKPGSKVELKVVRQGDVFVVNIPRRPYRRR